MTTDHFTLGYTKERAKKKESYLIGRRLLETGTELNTNITKKAEHRDLRKRSCFKELDESPVQSAPKRR